MESPTEPPIPPGISERFGLMTVAEARARLRAGLSKGLVCPCCDRLAKEYKRRFNATMAKGLMWMANAGASVPGGWVNISDAAPRSILRTYQVVFGHWWGLLEAQVDDEGHRVAGVYRVTEFGHRVIAGEPLPKFVFCYADKRTGFSVETTTLAEALASGGFKEGELMAPTTGKRRGGDESQPEGE